MGIHHGRHVCNKYSFIDSKFSGYKGRCQQPGQLFANRINQLFSRNFQREIQLDILVLKYLIH